MNEPQLKLYQYGHNKKLNSSFYVHFVEGSAWLTEEKIIKLFNMSKKEFNEMLETAYPHGRYLKHAYSKYFTFTDYNCLLKNREQKLYFNTDAILAVGYQKDAVKASEFRSWVERNIKSSYASYRFQKIIKLYIIQLVLKIIVAFTIAYYVSLALSELTNIGEKLSYLLGGLAFMMTMYDTLFDAMRYSTTHEFWEAKNKV